MTEARPSSTCSLGGREGTGAPPRLQGDAGQVSKHLSPDFHLQNADNHSAHHVGLQKRREREMAPIENVPEVLDVIASGGLTCTVTSNPPPTHTHTTFTIPVVCAGPGLWLIHVTYPRSPPRAQPSDWGTWAPGGHPFWPSCPSCTQAPVEASGPGQCHSAWLSPMAGPPEHTGCPSHPSIVGSFLSLIRPLFCPAEPGPVF